MSICIRILMLVSLLTVPYINAQQNAGQAGIAAQPAMAGQAGMAAQPAMVGQAGIMAQPGMVGVRGLEDIGIMGVGLPGMGVTGLPLGSMMPGMGVTNIAAGAIANLIKVGKKLRNDLDRGQRRQLRNGIDGVVNAVRLAQMSYGPYIHLS